MSVEGIRFDRAVPVYAQPKSCCDATFVFQRPITRRLLRGLHNRSGVNGDLSVEVARAGGARVASTRPPFPYFGWFGQDIDHGGPQKGCLRKRPPATEITLTSKFFRHPNTGLKAWIWNLKND